MIPQITAQEFETQLSANEHLTLVEFYTDRCSHCQQLLPVLTEIANEKTEGLRIYKFDAGNEPEFASRFRIRTVPNLILFQGTTPVAQRSGFAPKRELLKWIDEAGKDGSELI